MVEAQQRWRCNCAYDGTDFAGWQKQPNGNAVQDFINSGLGEIFHKPIKTVGAGRTDAGVHANMQVFHFDHNWTHGENSLLQAMRTKFPPGISPISVEKVDSSFHAHLSAKGKRYIYRMVRGWALPRDERFLLSLKNLNPDISLMSLSSECFLGEHDFSAFAARTGGSTKENPLKKVWRVDIVESSKCIEIVVEGGGFLYKMVRSIVGALLDVGIKKLNREDIHKILESGKRTEKVVSAPAHGLTLEKVFY